jgi:TolA-binding protein
MRVRPLLILTAIVSSLLGAVAVYLVMTVPNDLAADALLKQAKKDLADGKSAKARESLSTLIQQYPRTDGAAAATVALVSIAEQERAKLARDIAALRRDFDAQKQQLAAVQQQTTQLANAPPKVITVQAPAPKKKAPPPKRRRR